MHEQLPTVWYQAPTTCEHQHEPAAEHAYLALSSGRQA